jgi:TRAP-type mannitol/chloroaromatic compound transport system permease small subunit
MHQIDRFVRAIDALNEAVGRTVAWLCLFMVVVTALVAFLRYAFAIGFVWMQESYVWAHGVLFMAGAGFTLLRDGHVRVDVFYRPRGVRYKAWVDLLGSLFLLLPVVVLIGAVSQEYVIDSWRRLEASDQVGGLPGLFLLKSMIWVFCGLVGLQGLSLAGRSFLTLARYPGYGGSDKRADGGTATHG